MAWRRSGVRIPIAPHRPYERRSPVRRRGFFVFTGGSVSHGSKAQPRTGTAPVHHLQPGGTGLWGSSSHTSTMFHRLPQAVDGHPEGFEIGYSRHRGICPAGIEGGPQQILGPDGRDARVDGAVLVATFDELVESDVSVFSNFFVRIPTALGHCVGRCCHLRLEGLVREGKYGGFT